jgi:hypothetical protein
MRSRLAFGLLICFVSISPAASAPAAEEPSNVEMRSIFDADQGVRSDSTAFYKNAARIASEDATRRARTRQLLDSGALRSGDDYYEAAFVFQHGDKPADFLLAHTLAMVAVAKGRSDALWIASATLDRYLQNIGQPQIYGTQYKSSWDFVAGAPDMSKAVTTQAPYDRSLVPDALREALHVPSLKEQEARRAEMERELRAQQPLSPSLSGPTVKN